MADAETLAGLKARGAKSLPAYAIQAVPRLTLDEEVMASGSAAALGSPRVAKITVYAPEQAPSVDTSCFTLGDETVLSVNAAGIN